MTIKITDWISGLILALVVILSVTCSTGKKSTSSDKAVGYGSLHGYVYNADKEQLLSGAKVVCDDKTAFTNAGGYYKFEYIRKGNRTIEVSKIDYKTHSGMVEVTDHTTYSIFLWPEYPHAPPQGIGIPENR
jgi:hypothetical protein